MNKLICNYNKRKGNFKRVNCELCTYSSRCQDLHEYQQGHDDERRLENVNEREEAEIGKD